MGFKRGDEHLGSFNRSKRHENINRKYLGRKSVYG